MKRHNPMKKAFYFFAVLLLLSCQHASQKGHTVSVRIDPDEAESSIAADEWLDTAGCALIPLADTEKPITNAVRLKTHGDKIYALPACVPRGRDTRLLHRPTRKGGQRILVALGLPCHGRTPLPVGPYRAKDSGM